MKQQDVLLFYLNKISKREISPKSTSEILEFIKQESEAVFDVFCGSPKVFNEIPKDLKSLRFRLKNTEIKDICLPGQDKFIDLIIEAFFLEEKYRPVLTLVVQMERYIKLRRLIGEVSGSRRPVLNKKYTEYISKFCGIKENELKKVLDLYSPLFRRGVLTLDSDGDIDLSSPVQKVLYAGNIRTANDVRKNILHESKKTKLAVKDFCDIQDEIAYLGKVLSNALENKIQGINILIYGDTGTGKTEFSKVLAKSLNVKLYEMGKPKNGADVQGLCAAQALLMDDKGSLILMDDADDILAKDGSFDTDSARSFINYNMESNSVPIIWIVNSASGIGKSYLRRFTYCLKFHKPETEQRKKIWTKICKKHSLYMSKEEISELAGRYDVAPSVINAAVLNRTLTGQEDAISRTIDSFSEVIYGSKKEDKKFQELNDFNPQILNTDIDLILLGEKLANGNEKNFSLCLYGVAGTGKSLYARYLAKRLNMKVIQKRASDLSSKYIGETEKNIANAFREAKTENAILVFDEADSFLNSRDNTSRIHEVSAVNEMLTNMENADVPFICTTNLMDNIDKAALRRFTFKVKYDYLTTRQLELAYQHFFKTRLPVSQAENMRYLTPGDFFVVRKKARILGITDDDEIIKMLKEEIKAKGKTVKTKIGF